MSKAFGKAAAVASANSITIPVFGILNLTCTSWIPLSKLEPHFGQKRDLASLSVPHDGHTLPCCLSEDSTSLRSLVNWSWLIPIDLQNRLSGFESFTHFHPVFLYESLFCFLLFVFLICRNVALPRSIFGLNEAMPRSYKSGYIFISYIFLCGIIISNSMPTA